MRIAILSFYSGHIERGAETWTHEFANRISKDAYEVTVFQNGKTRKGADYTVVETGLPVNFKGSHFGEVFFLDYWSLLIAKFTLKVIPFLWRGKFDIVIPTNGRWQAWLLRILTWLGGAKMVVVGHAGIGKDEIWNLWTMPNVFVALSTRAKEWAKRINPFVRSVYIPNGVDLKKFSPGDTQVKISLPRPIVLFVGALEDGKRPLEAIKAISKLDAGSLLIVGNGSLKHSLEKVGKSLLPGRFAIKSFPYNQMPQVYRAADAFTAPSRSYYSFDIVLLEAMASNLPVVANDDPIRREIIEDTGVLVDPENTQAYAEAIAEVLAHDWGNKPRAQAQKFSWDKVAGQYKDLFDKLVR